MNKEKITVIWADGFSFTWDYSPMRGIFGGKKLLGLLKTRGDPKEIVGDGKIAVLMRKEYGLYQANSKEYKGINMGETLKVGSSMVGVPVERIEQNLDKLKAKLNRKL